MIPNLDIAFVLFLSLGAVAVIAVVYYMLRIAREWLRRWTGATNGPICRAVVPDSSLDAHIATQWTEGRLRLDVLLALSKRLGGSLEQEVETLRRLDHADLRYEREARQMVGPTLRRFTFDRHLLDECRMLIPLLQFCAKDLGESQGLDMTKKLSVLAEIQAAIKSADRG
ncbi:MAG: hypothetical protein ABI980_08405 [Nitrospirota bacterium]